MPSINFQMQFASAVANGTKTQTIRPKRKRPIKVGDTLHLFTGLRTGNCRKLMVGECTRLCPVTISAEGALRVDGIYLDPSDENLFAQQDGFRKYDELIEFIQGAYGLPFTGDVIHWRCQGLSAHH